MTHATQKAFEFFHQLGQQLATQDNRATSEPVFQIIIREPGGDRVTDAFFTQQALSDYLDRHGYRANMVDYVASGHRNPEWVKIRQLALSTLILEEDEAIKAIEETLPPLAESLRSQDGYATSEPAYQVIDQVPMDLESTPEYRVVKAICLTEKAAKEFISINEAKLHQPVIYVESGWQNTEWIELRRVILNMAGTKQTA